MKAAAAPTHVYVFGFTDGVIKVGRTSNPANRRQQHADAARIRRATINNEWVLEHDNAKMVEGQLIQLAAWNMDRLMGEYFTGNFRRFMKKVNRRFERNGILPAERLDWREVKEQYGVSDQDLANAREDGSLKQYFQTRTADEPFPPALFLKSEVDKWFSRYGIAERLAERAEAFQWRQDNKGGILEAAKRRHHMHLIEEFEARA